MVENQDKKIGKGNSDVTVCTILHDEMSISMNKIFNYTVDKLLCDITTA